MGAGRKTQTVTLSEKCTPSSSTVNSFVPAKNLRRSDLGGVIFGCTHATMPECLSKQLFGLPFGHNSYVKNIEPGLPLFLFNYSDRKLHGIYEAASQGQVNIDPYAWTDGGTERSPFPAQVRIRIKALCNSVTENQFRDVIKDNYYIPLHFWFELDHAQTRGLTALFKPLPANPKLTRVQPRLSIKSAVAPVASSWTDLFKAVPSTSLNATNDQEYGNSKALEAKNSDFSSDLANEDEFAAYHLDNRDTKRGNSSKTSSSSPGDKEPSEQISDWEDLEDIAQDTQSGGDTHFNGHYQPMKIIESSDGVLETDVELVLHKLKKLAASREICSSSSLGCVSSTAIPIQYDLGDMHENNGHCSEEPDTLSGEKFLTASYPHHENAKMLQVIKELIERTINLEERQVESDQEIKRLKDWAKNLEVKMQLLKDRVRDLQVKSDPSMALEDSLGKFVEQCLGSENVIYLIGGFNGSSWLSALDSFSPSLDVLTPLKPMNYIRSYASSVAVNGNMYVFGGGDGSSWYDSVECYDPRRDKWTLCPHMIHEKGSLAGATLHSKIYAIGGGDGSVCFSDVEMFDPALGKWINNQSMLQKRFAPAAAAIGGALYVVGGYNGTDYLQSAERYDPREPFWSKLPSMKTSRGCLSLAVFNEKLYAIGGYDGQKMISDVEIFDPRMGSWMTGESMNFARGYAAAAVLGDTLFAIGGVKDGENVVEAVECYKEGTGGWAISSVKSVGKRCFCSGIVL